LARPATDAAVVASPPIKTESIDTWGWEPARKALRALVTTDRACVQARKKVGARRAAMATEGIGWIRRTFCQRIGTTPAVATHQEYQEIF